MQILFALNAILALAGFLLPIPFLILALREVLKLTRTSASKPWRRVASKMAFLVCVLGFALWTYALVRQIHGTYSYILLSASVGRWGAAGLIGVSSLAERRLRLYLLLGSIGIWCFFGVSIGDVFL
ncbi:MAG: hypothetical protein WCE50_18155 [Candidatus Acidiferrum sp.]